MVLNQGAFRILSSIAFETKKKQKKEKQRETKKQDFGKTFFIFKFFKLLEI